MQKCTNCQQETKNPKFCSTKCAATYTNKNGPPKKKSKPRPCSRCFKMFIPLPRQCTRQDCYECRADGASRFDSYKKCTVGEFRTNPKNKGRHPSWIHAEIRQLNRLWNADLRKLPCKNCKYSKHVELCHIKAISSFTDDALVSDINSKKNIIQLCRNCHWELDHGLLTMKEIHSIHLS